MNAIVKPARNTLEPTNVAEAMQFCKMLADSDMIPVAFKGKPANVFVAVQWGREVGLGPLQALQNVAVINGRPSIWGDAALALVSGHRDCEDIIETLTGEGDDAVATCEVRRRGRQPVIRTFSMGDAKLAGLKDKQGPWKQYPKRMLQQRARGFAIRDAFPDALRGIITTEEARDIPVDTFVGRTIEAKAEPVRQQAQQFTAGEVIGDSIPNFDAPPPKKPSLREIIFSKLKAATTQQEVIAVGESPEVLKVMREGPEDVKREVNDMLAEAFDRLRAPVEGDDFPALDDLMTGVIGNGAAP